MNYNYINMTTTNSNIMNITYGNFTNMTTNTTTIINDNNINNNIQNNNIIIIHPFIQLIIKIIKLRQDFFLIRIEPIIIKLFGPLDDIIIDNNNDIIKITTPTNNIQNDVRYLLSSLETTTTSENIKYQSLQCPDCYYINNTTTNFSTIDNNFHEYIELQQQQQEQQQQKIHRKLGFLPSYISTTNNLFNETSMSFSALTMLFITLSCVFLIFLSCFYHNQKTSPLFTSPRRHRLPKLVPPPLPVDGYFNWLIICFYLSDEEIINRIGYDSLIFIRFHRLALRCIVKMSVFSFIVLLPLNYTGGGHANAQDLKEYVDSLFFTDFLRFTMANVKSGSPRLWIHCFAAYLLTLIVIRELLVEYENFNSIRHRYLLSREPHLRTVLVTNIPRHLRSSSKITNYFKHVYPNAVKSVFICQNLILLEKLIIKRTKILHNIEKELLLLCRYEKKKLYYKYHIKNHNIIKKIINTDNIDDENISNNNCCGIYYNYHNKYDINNTQDRLTKFYNELEELNNLIENEQRRRQRVMKMLDKMNAGDGLKDIDYVLASPFISNTNKSHKLTLNLMNNNKNNKKSKVKNNNKDNNVNNDKNNYQPPLNNSSIHVDSNNSNLPRSIPEGNEKIDENTGYNNNEYDDDDNEQQFATEIEYNSDANNNNNNNNNNNSTNNKLRSRSPPSNEEPDGLMKNNNNDNVTYDVKKTRKTFAKARRAIKRYGKLNNEQNNLATPIHNNNPININGGQTSTIEDHINEVTDKAFVVMRTFTAATIAIQSMHSSKPGSMQVSTAPEPRDILWDNIYMSKGAHRTRTYLGEFVVLLIITFYIVPVAMIALLVSEQALVSSSPKLAQLAQASAFFSAIIALVQPLCVVGLQQLLPPLFIAIGRMEGLTSFSEVQMRAFSRYFLFQVLNVFLVTTIAGSIFDTIAMIIENPESAFEMLGNSLPRMSSFFITFVTIKTFLGLGFELVRTMALVQATARTIIFPNATLREKRTPMASMRAIDDPGWFPFHKILAQDMLVVVISVVFAVVAPLVTLPCALFCLCSRIMWTHHHLYVYESIFESGGQFWPKIFRRFVFGLIIAQMTITGQFILKEARHEAYATILLMFLTYVFLRSTRARYDPTSSTLPLEVATVMDISLKQDEESIHTYDESNAHDEPSSNHNKTNQIVSLSPRQQDPVHGTLIGQYDPFRKAYVQPALRANPRARPEQPFPAAQLGKEESFHNNTNINDGSASESTSTEGGWHDGKATVRLKSMNKNDRKLINRWWNDQLQRAGKQNNFLILIGEECGTLTISGPSMIDNELHGPPTLSSDHSSFV